MKIKPLIIIMLALIACLASCKKAPLSIGEIVTETRDLPNFKEVCLNDDISLSLVRSDTCYIVITTGENIIGNITTEVSGNVLNICNTSTLNWIRPYNFELHATLYYKDIKYLTFSSSGTLDTRNQYNDTTGVYKILIDGGSGDIDLNVKNCKGVYIQYKYGTSTINLHGRGNKYLNVTKRSYGIIDARNFETNYVDIENNSAGDCYIWSRDRIKAEINNLGDIYYRGNPDTISVTYGEFAKGKLLPL